MDIREVLQAADADLQKGIKEELRTQGHYLTGALAASIHGEITVKGEESATLVGTSLFYAQILNAGTTAARIPFGTHTGATTSKYIEGLINFFTLRGLDEAEAKRAAFATARVQKLQGMPTTGSYRFSDNNQRLNVLGIVEREMDTELDEVVLGGIENMVESVFKQTLSERI